MILTEEQKANINVLVSNEVEYCETYQEVYDHMITSFEARQTLPDLQKAYSEILEEDFGGHYGIEMLEENRRRIIIKESSQGRMEIFRWFFKWPGLIFMIACCGLCGYYFERFFMAINVLFSLGFSVLIISSLVAMAIGNYILRRRNGEVKPSINNISIKMLWRILGRWYFYLFLFSITCNLLDRWKIFTPSRHLYYLISAIVVDTAISLMILYLVAGLVVYKTEFKKRLAV